MEKIAAKATVLLSGILNFWKGLRDDQYGGYYGYVGQDLTLDKKAEKGCILNSRILWFFSEAAMLLNRADLRTEADHAYLFFMNHCLDRENGGVFWSVAYDGTVLDDTKHTYNQAFAIYALSSYYLLTQKKEALETAFSIYERLENTCRDTEGYLEAFTGRWALQSNEKLSENGVLADKTMNTLLHVFEAYTNLYRVSASPRVAQSMKDCIRIFSTKIYDADNRRQRVFFDAQYHSILDITSFGHDIEASWLFDEGVNLLQDPALRKEIEAIDTNLAEAVYERAYRNHSILNECERGIIDETRVWWVQAEAVVGFVNLWSKCKKPQYGNAACDILSFIQEKLVDTRPKSEWFWCLDADGVPIPGKPIVEPWKCPYHNGRMCMELIRRDPEIYV